VLNILYVNWKCFGASDLLEALSKNGLNVFEVELSDISHERIDWEYIEKLKVIFDRYSIDIIISFNFFPTLSEACNQYGRKYLSWVYDSPSMKIYMPSIINECNYVFIFDRAVVLELQKKGIKTVYYSPLAVNTERLAKLNRNKKELERYKCEVAFVGSLYNEKHHLYERLEKGADNPYLMGFLEGIMEAQMNIYGYNFIKKSLRPEIVQAIYKVMPFDVPEGAYVDRESVYSDYFICRRMAYLERSKIIYQLSKKHKFYHYTNDSSAFVGKAVNKGKVDYYDEMPYAFRHASVNLNMTLRSIKTGIPLRAMDIMGAGGFLLTNYQEDFMLHFKPDKEFVYYGSVEELEDKVNWYLEHDSERQKIAKNGRIRIEQNHTYTKTLKEMLKVVGVHD
jgi:spore maturation protein CgeB